MITTLDEARECLADLYIALMRATDYNVPHDVAEQWRQLAIWIKGIQEEPERKPKMPRPNWDEAPDGAIVWTCNPMRIEEQTWWNQVPILDEQHLFAFRPGLERIPEYQPEERR